MKNLLTDSLFIKGGTFENLDDFTPVQFYADGQQTMYFRVRGNILQMVCGGVVKAVKIVYDRQYAFAFQKTQIRSSDIEAQAKDCTKHMFALGCFRKYFVPNNKFAN